jgi:hypothetical protein
MFSPMKEGLFHPSVIEEIKSSLQDKGYAEIESKVFSKLAEKIALEPNIEYIQGKKREFELVENRFPIRDVVVIYDQSRIEAVEFVTSGSFDTQDEDLKDYNISRAAMYSLLRFPVINRTHLHKSGVEEERTIYFKPIEDKELQSA